MSLACQWIKYNNEQTMKKVHTATLVETINLIEGVCDPLIGIGDKSEKFACIYIAHSALMTPTEPHQSPRELHWALVTPHWAPMTPHGTTLSLTELHWATMSCTGLHWALVIPHWAPLIPQWIPLSPNES